jgi:hypothetical protein
MAQLDLLANGVGGIWPEIEQNKWQIFGFKFVTNQYEYCKR